MPQTRHIEHHFTGSNTVRDIVIGMSDGLTVPFALAAGLSGAINTTGIIVTAGLAEITAGSIAIGLGGYLTAKSDAEHYVSERTIEESEVREKPDVEAREITEVFQSYGLTPEECQPVVEALRNRPQAWIEFMMRFELGLEKPDPKRALISAATIAGAYIAGGRRSDRILFSRRPVRRSRPRPSLLSSRWRLLDTSRVALPARHGSEVRSKQRSWGGWRPPQLS